MTLILMEGKWKRNSFCYHAGRGILCAQFFFVCFLVSRSNIDMLVTVLCYKERRIKAARNHMPWRRIRNGSMSFWTLAGYRHPLPTYAQQKTPQTAYRVVACLHFRTWRRGAAGSCGRRSPKSATS
ncbi:hypothetical protein TcG_11136 [Trypanosoma cruzi]|nr:hypothetical protein TcG_11136 [Trypanosoma cruzi]